MSKVKIISILLFLFLFTYQVTGLVYNRNTGQTFGSITNALSSASNNHLIEADQGTYLDPINLSHFTNLTLRAIAWTNSGDNTSTRLLGAGDPNVITMTNGSRNKIVGFYIVESMQNGILITGNSVSNIIINNMIISNIQRGININGSSSKNNQIKSNQIIFNNQDGIRIDDSPNNIIMFNTLSSNNRHGIYFFGTAKSNLIKYNHITGNDMNGVVLDHEDCDYNTIHSNNICNVSGSEQNMGIEINRGDHNIIRYNGIYYHSTRGLYMYNDTDNNYIANNNLFQNTSQGIYIQNNTSGSNSIFSNTFWGESKAICIDDAVNTKICYNLAINNFKCGISLMGTSSGNELVNNTLVKNVTNGILLENTASGKMYNNIIFSNYNHGVNNAGTGNMIVAYNSFFGNSWGPTNGGGFTWGTGNITNHPQIAPGPFYRYEINSANSPAIDSGTNVTGITVRILGSAPDMGWKEYQGSGSSDDTTGPVTTPDKPEGTYAGSISVILTAVDNESPDNIEIYYTTDGSDPKSSSTIQMGISSVTVNINKTTDLKVYAKNTQDVSEDTKTFHYEIIKAPAEEAAVYNNLVDLSKGGSARIVIGTSDNIEIKIYNLKGVLVHHVLKQYYPAGSIIEWKGTIKNSAQKVGAGLYFISIKGNKISKNFKVLVKK